MPISAIATHPDILEGRLDRLRVATPVTRGIHLRIDGTPVIGVLEDEAQLRALRDLQPQRVPVRVGVLTDDAGTHHFSWLICPGRPAVPPSGYANELHRYGKMAVGGLAVAALGAMLVWLLGTDSLWRVFGMVAALVAVMAGVVFGGVAAHVVWRNWRMRDALLQSESSFHNDDGRPPSARPPPPELPPVPRKAKKGGRKRPAAPPAFDPTPPADYRLADDGAPPIAHVRGVLTSLTYESSQPFNTGQRWGIYRFLMGKEPYVFRVAENLAKPDPFLAERDRVELAVHAGESHRADRHRVVFALRNLEDGRVYVAHKAFRGARADAGPIGVGPTQRGALRRGVAGWLAAFWLMIVGLVWFTVDGAHLRGMVQVGLIAFACLFAVWLCIVLPFDHGDRRWRAGRPTQRQRTLERIYTVLDLGTPFAPTARIEEF